MSKTNIALDYPTRKLIGETIATTLADEFRGMTMSVDRVPVPTLHGPESVACETFVIGAVLSGGLPIDSVPLSRGEFWAELHGRVWEAMLEVGYSLVPYADEREAIAAVIEHAIERGALGGRVDHYIDQLWLWADMSAERLPLRDVAGAIVIIQEHARTRRLVSLLASLADELCGKGETFEGAKLRLRDLFVADARERRGE